MAVSSQGDLDMELTQASHGRRATRAYTQSPVAKPVLEQIIAAAIQAPGAVNAQSWDLTVIRSAALLDRISDASKAYALTAMAPGTLPPHLRERLEDPDFHIFYHAPALIVIAARSGAWAVEDATLAAENLILAAHGRGLGTCWIGFAQRWLETSDGKRAIEVPEDFQPVAPIIVGYASTPMPSVPRKPLNLRWID
ncbi:MAG TPA: nitroreductase family protein [Rhodopila sp.]